MEFEWDEGNRDKNRRHGVEDWEIEEAFEDPRRVSLGRTRYPSEERFVVLGRSLTSGKYLRVVYTERQGSGLTYVRPISAYEMAQAERRRYQRQ